MQNPRAEDLWFDCPSCNMRVIVDEDVRELLVSEGCAICTADVSPDDFEWLPET